MDSQQLGKSMITAAWIGALVILTWFFNGVLERRNNPNSHIISNGAQTVVLQRNPQGHYVANGQINGKSVTFFVDTGATSVVIPLKIANELNLEQNMEITVSTANGNAKAYLTRLETVSLGGITLQDVGGHISPNMDGDEILLGMSFLKHLSFSQQNNQLTLKIPQNP